MTSFVDLYHQWDLHSFILRVPERAAVSSTGSAILSELIASIGPAKIKAAQQKSKRCFLFQLVDKKTATSIRLSGVAFRSILLTPEVAFAKATNVFVSRVPPEVTDDHFVTALSPHGKVLSCKRLYLKDHPTILSGTRLVRVVLTKPVPFFFKVGDQLATVTYRGQPPTCYKCREIGHKHADCPLPPSPRRHRRKRPRTDPLPPAADSVGSTVPVPSLIPPPQPPSVPSDSPLLPTGQPSPGSVDVTVPSPLVDPGPPPSTPSSPISPSLTPPPPPLPVVCDVATDPPIYDPGLGFGTALRPFTIQQQYSVFVHRNPAKYEVASSASMLFKAIKTSLEEDRRGTFYSLHLWSAPVGLPELVCRGRAYLEQHPEYDLVAFYSKLPSGPSTSPKTAEFQI